MLKFLIFLIAAYFVYKIFKAQLMPKKPDEKVKGKKSDSSPKRKMDNKNIEDADFEEID